MAGEGFSRRDLLLGAGITLSLPLLNAAPEPKAFGLEVLLSGDGLVPISAGEFMMGFAKGTPDEAPVHRVRITQPFEISKYEVTQVQWKTVMTDPHKPDMTFPTSQGAEVGSHPSKFQGENLPVDNVSWDDIQVFFDRLNARDQTHKYRLPTEAEWEYVCKAGKPENHPPDLAKVAWYKENSEKGTHAVGQKQPNAWGVYDMYGNVSEWVQDWYGFNYYGNSPAEDPKGPTEGSYRIYRGGCWFDASADCRASYRRFDFPISRFYNVGFRVVRTPR